MNADQQAFYNHLKQAHPRFISRNKTTFPHLDHLTTPADRYRNICESYVPPKHQMDKAFH